MRLVSFSVEGYRRFGTAQVVPVLGKMTAFIGPNQAGKTSILDALSRLNDEDPFPLRDRPRGNSPAERPTIDATFTLDDGDLSAIAPLDPDHLVRAITVTKDPDGDLLMDFHPGVPDRPTYERRQLAAFVSMFVDHLDTDEFGWTDSERETLQPAQAALGSQKESLDEDALQTIMTLADYLSDLPVPSNELEEGAPEAKVALHAQTEQDHERFKKYAAMLSRRLRALHQVESDPTPTRLIADVLWKRVPEFERFDERHRRLRHEYELDSIDLEDEIALANLLILADLDLEAVKAAVAEGDDTRRRGLYEQANETLKERFSSRWSQADIEVSLEIDPSRLLIFMKARGSSTYARLDEQSDGLRIFLALLTFLYRRAEDQRTILMVDELETHLHYDAQSDVVQVMYEQDVAQQVIYTTHSIGCLPRDIGSSIRAVSTVGHQRSEVISNIWRKDVGFRPLMIGLGASGMSFTPLRSTLLCEGLSDAILLPAILRLCDPEDEVRYHVAPSISAVGDFTETDLGDSPHFTAAFVDGDAAGDGHAQRLSAVLLPERIVSLSTFLGPDSVIEDLIKADLYHELVLAEIELHSGGHGSLLTLTDLGDRNRPRRLRD
jgi:hypothetical protein